MLIMQLNICTDPFFDIFQQAMGLNVTLSPLVLSLRPLTKLRPPDFSLSLKLNRLATRAESALCVLVILLGHKAGCAN